MFAAVLGFRVKQLGASFPPHPCWVFQGVRTGTPATSSSSSSSLELPVPPHDEYTCIHTTEATDTTREDSKSNLTAGPGEQIAFPLGGRKASVSPLRPRIRWRERSKWLQGCTPLQVKSHPFPAILSSSRLTFHFTPHSFRHQRSVTRRHGGTAFLPLIFQQ